MLFKFRKGLPYARPLPQDEPPLMVKSKAVNTSGGDNIDEETRRKLAVFLTRRE